MIKTLPTECIHSMALIPSECSMCKDMVRGHQPGTEPDGAAEPEGHPFSARHSGDCPGCDLPIGSGQIIRKWTDQRYYHAGNNPCTP